MDSATSGAAPWGVTASHPFRSWAKPQPVAETAREIAESLPETAWRRLSAGEGTMDERPHDWAYLELADLVLGAYDDALTGPWTRGLPIRRHSADGDLAFFSTWCPKGTSIETLVRLEGHRWAIEDSFETAKNELGPDRNETRSWHGWHRHVSLVVLAFAMTAAIRRIGTRLARRRIQPVHVIAWSLWRRAHQAEARRSHLKSKAQL